MVEIKRYPTYHISFDSKEEEAAFHAFSAARGSARMLCKEGQITVEECAARYAAAAAVWKFATGKPPPYGIGKAKKPRVP